MGFCSLRPAPINDNRIVPRRPRITLPAIPLHVIQRGNNRQACFFGKKDWTTYLNSMEHFAAESDVHAYVLVTNHVHLRRMPRTDGCAGALMKGSGQRYLPWVNRTYPPHRHPLGRTRSIVSHPGGGYVLSCYRFVELNPVRANMVDRPAEYRWSSYRANAQGAASTLLIPHPYYRKMGCNEQVRQTAYRELLHSWLDAATIDEICFATDGNVALGTSRFQAQFAVALGRRVTPNQVLFSIVPEFNMKKALRSLQKVEAMAFDQMVFSHGMRVGGKGEVSPMRRFIVGLQEAIRAEFGKGTPFTQIPSAVKLPRISGMGHVRAAAAVERLAGDAGRLDGHVAVAPGAGRQLNTIGLRAGVAGVPVRARCDPNWRRLPDPPQRHFRPHDLRVTCSARLHQAGVFKEDRQAAELRRP